MKVLLSSPIKPFTGFIEGRDRLHIKYGNTTYGQDIYSMSLISHYYGLHLIAQNIRAKTTVLENPDKKVFLREIRKQYKFVGIYFVIPFYSKVIEMSKLVRQHSPGSKIVIGGPGVECLKHLDGKHNELVSLVDYICRGDGIKYFKDLLGEKNFKPLNQDFPMSAVAAFGFKKLASYAPALISELGCTDSCEFCSSSAFYDHKRIQIADPDELFFIVKNYIRKYRVTTGRIIDENFLNNKSYVERFGKLLKEHFYTHKQFFTYSTFASLKAISKYDIEELIDYGVSGILIGVESNLVGELHGNVKKKLTTTDTSKVFEDLRNSGIFIEGSMILGWDFHNKFNITKDIEKYISLKSTFDQIVCLQAVPGTVLWERLKKENRLAKNIDWDDGGFYSRWFSYKNFSHEEIWKYEETALKKAYEKWGPSYLRYFEVNLNGYVKYKTSNVNYLKARAEYHKNICREVYPLLLCMKIFSPNIKIKNEVKKLETLYLREFGRPSIKNNALSYFAVLLGAYRKIEQKLFKEKMIQPDFFIYQYN